MSDVYEGWDEELAIFVALKTLRIQPIQDADRAIRHLKQEAMLARSIVHPNVCRVYDIACHGLERGHVWFLTMEVLKGETLQERLRERGKLTPEEALPLVAQMTAGLEAAHQAGVVHGDFKSGNVMLVDGAQGEQAVVTDFGLAREIRDRAGAKAASVERETGAGTPAYMAPEQVRGEETGPAADIYALGVVLYEMVTGELPFTGATPWEAALRRLKEPPPSPRVVMPELEERWEQVILRCLAREPRQRFLRAGEVAKALAGLEDAPTPDVAPGAQSGQRSHYTLPAERDAFIGRETDLAELEQRHAGGSRLVTLLGAAGMGKTRVAVRYARQELGRWPGGVWFCDLSEARSLNGIVSAVARSLSVQLGRTDPVTQLGHAIAGRGQCLVVLDNFEQVVEHAAETLGAWLGRAESASFLVTSREPLSLPGEELQRVEPLGLESGLALFVERARRLCPGLQVVGPELAAAEEVVRLVEGMPLAIELAAARMRVMSAEKLVGAMRKRFQLLTGGPSARHETLSAAIDGSWELLQPWEKAAFAQCSVFEGGFTLEAAEGVLDLGAWPEAPWVVDLVQSLVDKSLVKTWVAEDLTGAGVPEARFGMYASLQEYARGKLKEEGAIPGGGSGAGADRAAAERHGRWFARSGTEEALEALHQHGGVEQAWRLQRELENLVAASRRAVTRGDGETAAAVCQAAWAVLELRGPFGTGVDLGHEVLKAPLGRTEQGTILSMLGQAELRSGRMDAARNHIRAALAIHREVGNRRFEGVSNADLGTLYIDQGRFKKARDHYDNALAIYREIGDRHHEGRVLSNLGNLLRQLGRMEEARNNLEAALAIHRKVGDRRNEGIVLGYLGLMLYDQSRMEEARAHYEAALAIHRQTGDRRGEGAVLVNLSTLDLEQSRTKESRAHLEAALAIHREVGDRRSEGIVLVNLGNLNLEQGRSEEARAHYEGALIIHREIGDRRHEGFSLVNLGLLHCAEGRTDEGELHYEAALALARELGLRQLKGAALRNRGNQHLRQGRIEEARADLEAALVIHQEMGNRRLEGVVLGCLGTLHYDQGRTAAARDALARGEALLREVGDRLYLGKLICTRARMELEAGDPAWARATLSEAEALAEQLEANPESELRRVIAQLREAVCGSA